MKSDLNTLERQLDSRMKLLKSAPDPQPDERCVQRVKRGVAIEARLYGPAGSGLVLNRVRIWSTAAAFVLAAGLAWQMSSVKSNPLPSETPMSLASLTHAIDASADAVSRLVDDTWLPVGADAEGRSDEDVLDDLLDTLDSALNWDV